MQNELKAIAAEMRELNARLESLARRLEALETLEDAPVESATEEPPVETVIEEIPTIIEEIIMVEPEADPATEPEPELEAELEPEAEEEPVEEEEPVNATERTIAPIKLTLNDRYRFRRELFGNSDAEMAELLSLIEAMQSADEVKEYLSEDLGWDLEDPNVGDFVDACCLRFSNRSPLFGN